MPTPAECLAYDKAQLEFLINKCFISGFGNRLSSLTSDIGLFFQPPEESWVKSLKEQGISCSSTSEEYRISAYDNFHVLSSTYEQLPWGDLTLPSGAPRKKIYTPFAVSKYILQVFMPNELSETLFDPRIKPHEHANLMDRIKSIRNCSQTLEKTVAELRTRIEEVTGEKAPRFPPAFEIHKNPEKYIGVLY